MSEPLFIAPKPCNTCPYARSTPPGIWHPDEYAKLPTYDDDAAEPSVATFHCHQETATHVPTVCRGWLYVHADSIAVRFAVVTGQLDLSDLPPASERDPSLYASGAEACAASMAAIEQPPPAARRAQQRLVRKGVGR